MSEQAQTAAADALMQGTPAAEGTPVLKPVEPEQPAVDPKTIEGTEAWVVDNIKAIREGVDWMRRRFG